MKSVLRLAGFLLVQLALSSGGAVHFVDLNSTNATPPFSDWTTAATNIQDAIDVAVAGDQILVTNGTYQIGGRLASGGTLSNRVIVNKAVTLQSVNGPAYTTIKGYQAPVITNGNSAVRCVYLTNNAVLSGFTVTNGATHNGPFSSSDFVGGGVYCRSSTSIVTNCVITGNAAALQGGGVFQGTIYNSTVQGNTSANGGGAFAASLRNCYVIGNSATNLGGGACLGSIINSTIAANVARTSGGGIYQCPATNCTLTVNTAGSTGGAADTSTLNNCLLYYNTAPSGFNYFGGTLNSCCTMPMPPAGVGNITNEPQSTSISHLSASSPCIGAGTAGDAQGADIDGESWSNPPAIGCDEFHPGAVTGSLTSAIQVDYTNLTTILAANFTAQIEGRVSASAWDFGDGTLISNRVFVSHQWASPGDYNVQLTAFNDSHPAGVSATVTIHVASPPIHHVDLNSTNPQPPFLSWATAATNIQDAVDVASLGSIVIVTNGVYDRGVRAVFGNMSNRVAITKPIVVISVNGPGVTIIKGAQTPGTQTGNSSVRCAYLTNGATLIGFTLTNGATRQAADVRLGSGGCVWMESGSATISNCIISGSVAHTFGGGLFGGKAVNCLFTGNSAPRGGGACSNTLLNCAFTACRAARGGAAYGGALNNCTATGNTAESAGGVEFCALNNCLIYYNTAFVQPNYSSCTFNYSCATPLPAGGIGNTDAEPQLADSLHLSVNSPCRQAGSSAYAAGIDVDGNPWLVPPSIGVDEFYDGTALGALNVSIRASYTNIASGFALSLTGQIDGHASSNEWSFGDGTIANTIPYVIHTWTNQGDYLVVFKAYNEDNPLGVSATVTIHVVNQPIHYVDLNSTNPVPPYLTWNTAATNIQDAVDAAIVGGTIVVTNGSYGVGMRTFVGDNRVAINKPLTVQSVNGAAATIIDGKGDPVRCAYVISGAKLVGFTLTNGLGGIFCESPAASVSNCVITRSSNGGVVGGTFNDCLLTGNATPGGGGGASGSILNNCILSGNRAFVGGGAISCTLNNCTLSSNVTENDGTAGGAFSCTLSNCFVLGNYAYGFNGIAGGAAASTLYNCVVAGNSANQVGGVSFGTLYNCTVVDNASGFGPGGIGNGTLKNCIVYNNSGGNYGGGVFDSCCTTPLPAGSGNFTNEPLFAIGEYRLQSNSPCINAGNNAFVASSTDLDGNPRIAGGTVDVGAYEFQSPTSILSYAWAQQFGLPTDGSADFGDPDGDHLNNWQEWIVGTIPTNSSSVLALNSPVPASTGLTVSWQSVAGKSYFLQRATDLLSSQAFSVLQSNIVGQAGTTAYPDTSATNGGPYFYRVGVGAQ